MQEQPGGEDRTVKPFKITWAQPGDPIYSEGWTVGAGPIRFPPPKPSPEDEPERRDGEDPDRASGPREQA
jgi:hypothetical protein